MLLASNRALNRIPIASERRAVAAEAGILADSQARVFFAEGVELIILLCRGRASDVASRVSVGRGGRGRDRTRTVAAVGRFPLRRGFRAVAVRGLAALDVGALVAVAAVNADGDAIDRASAFVRRTYLRRHLGLLRQGRRAGALGTGVAEYTGVARVSEGDGRIAHADGAALGSGNQLDLTIADAVRVLQLVQERCPGKSLADLGLTIFDTLTIESPYLPFGTVRSTDALRAAQRTALRACVERLYNGDLPEVAVALIQWNPTVIEAGLPHSLPYRSIGDNTSGRAGAARCRCSRLITGLIFVSDGRIVGCRSLRNRACEQGANQ